MQDRDKTPQFQTLSKRLQPSDCCLAYIFRNQLNPLFSAFDWARFTVLYQLRVFEGTANDPFRFTYTHF